MIMGHKNAGSELRKGRGKEMAGPSREVIGEMRPEREAAQQAPSRGNSGESAGTREYNAVDANYCNVGRRGHVRKR